MDAASSGVCPDSARWIIVLEYRVGGALIFAAEWQAYVEIFYFSKTSKI